MIKTKKQSLIVIGAFLLVMILGTVTYAFFNYTRTGTANNIRTGRIYFNSTQNGALNMTNLFPIASSEVDNEVLDSISVRLYGDTTYSGGEEFEVTLTDVNNVVGTSPNEKTIPINFIATYEPTATGEVIGSAAVSDYFTERGQSTAVYKLTETGTVENNKQVLVGFIPRNGEIDGTLTIKAYLDITNIGISDTYPAEVTETNNDGYLDGTPASFGENRVVLTTTEWNDLQNAQNPLSFKIKVVSQEGIWANPQIESCIGCKFIYTTNEYLYSANNYASSPSSSLATFESNNETLVDDYRTLNKNIFLGFKFDGSGNVTNGYACGIKGEDPNNGIAFCIEGALSDSYGGNSKKRNDLYNANSAILESLYGSFDSERGVGCHVDATDTFPCNGAVYSYTARYGMVYTALNGVNSDCTVFNFGGAFCK